MWGGGVPYRRGHAIGFGASVAGNYYVGSLFKKAGYLGWGGGMGRKGIQL